MAQVRHIVTPPGKAPVEFFAPEDANDGQLQVLASRALAAQYPSESFITPVLDAATRESLEQPERQLTQPEILARQGEISSRDPSYRERDIEGLTSALSKVGFSDMARAKASGLVNDVYDWTPVGSAEAADEAIRDAGGGRYLDAAGNALVAGLDVIPEVGQGASALAMFLGRNAKTANLDMLRKAEQMAEQGAPRDQILRQTGWFNQHGDWKYEIPDNNLKLNMENLPRFGEKVPLRNVVSHPELEAAYPDAWPHLKFQKNNDPKSGGSWDDFGGVLKSNYESDDRMRSITAHELQHFVQGQEGFPLGAAPSPQLVNQVATPEALALRQQHADALEERLLRLDEDEADPMLPEVEARIADLEDRLFQIEPSEREAYTRTAGEAEARNVQRRLNNSDFERQLRTPWNTQDVADERQFVLRDGEGPQASYGSVEDFTTAAGRGQVRQARGPEESFASILDPDSPVRAQDFDIGSGHPLSEAYEMGELTDQAQAAGLVVDDDMMGKMIVGRTQADVDRLKHAKTPNDLGKSYGYSDDDIAAFYQQRRGGDPRAGYADYTSDLGDVQMSMDPPPAPVSVLSGFDRPGVVVPQPNALAGAEPGAKLSPKDRAASTFQREGLDLTAPWSPYGMVKLRQPHGEMTQGVDQYHQFGDRPLLDPQNMSGAIIPLVGDRARTGARLTSVGDTPLSSPVDLQGGPLYPQFHAEQGSPGVWASHPTVTSGIVGHARRAADQYGDVTGIYSAMGPRAVDFNVMTATALLGQLDNSKVAKGALRDFDKDIRKVFPKFAGVSDPANRQLLEQQLQANAELRKRFVKRMDLAPRRNAGFPDVAATRYAISEPGLRDMPEGVTGLSAARIDPKLGVISEPWIGHDTYSTQIGGEYLGGFGVPLRREEVFPDFFAARRAQGVDPYGDRRSFEISNVLQPITPEWQDTLSRLIELKKAQGLSY